jgi:hypothetical protein
MPVDYSVLKTNDERDCARVIIGVLDDLPPLERARAIAATTAALGFDGRAAKPSRRRRPGIATLIKRAEKSGKAVTSITTPDGTTLHFGEGEDTEASNPWLADLEGKAKQ